MRGCAPSPLRSMILLEGTGVRRPIQSREVAAIRRRGEEKDNNGMGCVCCESIRTKRAEQREGLTTLT